MYSLLTGLRVVEASSFIASPSCGLYLAQMGAEVIRIDQLGGGLDFHRWPKADNGASLYWEGLNKGKKSIAIDLGRPEGRELAGSLITAPGESGGLFVTNFPLAGFLAHEQLAVRRSDLVSVRIMGQANGGSALDYTVNCSLGIPQITGPASLADEPVNHVLPTWDLLAGAYAAFALLAACHWRRATGQGQEVRVPLADMGIATIANLGMLAEVLVTGGERARYGNDVFGAFGRDFVTADGKRIMLMAITPRQWSGLVESLDIGAAIARIESERDVSFAKDEGLRFVHRDAIVPLVEAAVARHALGALAPAFDRLGVCWGPYRTMQEAIDDPHLVRANPIFSAIEQASGLTYPVPGAPATLPALDRQPARRAPRLGEHGDEILAQVLGLSSGAIARLHDHGIVG
jgi:2-methylfumaryl-CoA isomerase